jgi:tetratricopeptide (TPR) repeat protein
VGEARIRRERGASLPVAEPQNPHVVAALLGLSYCQVEVGDLDGALATVNRVLDLDPGNVEGVCELSYIYCLNGRRAEALEQLQSAAASFPDNARVHKALGYYHLQDNDFAQAIAACSEAIRCDPTYDLAHAELAGALGRSGRTDEAITHMWRALRLAPSNAEYYLSLAALLRETRRVEEARRVLQRGLRLNPGHPELLQTLAEVCLEGGHPELAIEHGHTLLRTAFGSIAARDVLGAAYLQLGRINEALRMADQMVQLNPLDPSHHFKKGVLFQQQGMVRQALDAFERVARLAPESDLGAEASHAIESMDNLQMRQIMVLASADPVFRTRLQRDCTEAVEERGFHLSEKGTLALQALVQDGFSASHVSARPLVYH